MVEKVKEREGKNPAVSFFSWDKQGVETNAMRVGGEKRTEFTGTVEEDDEIHIATSLFTTDK
jgi:hypothetical protein